MCGYFDGVITADHEFKGRLVESVLVIELLWVIVGVDTHVEVNDLFYFETGVFELRKE